LHHPIEQRKIMSMTTNDLSVVDEETFSVRRTIRIAASVDKVWAAVTQPAHISRWFAPTVLDGAGVGASGTITFPGYGAVPLLVEAVDEPRSVTYRWGNDDAAGRLPESVDPEHSTVFTFSLEPDGDHTRLTVVESGFETTSDPRSNLYDHQEGWNSELDKLVALFESGS
jgi:uncharacterized protein YndB with AHSA1/START domain